MDEFTRGRIEGLKTAIRIIERSLIGKKYSDYSEVDQEKEYLLFKLREEIESLIFPREPLFKEKEALNPFGV